MKGRYGNTRCRASTPADGLAEGVGGDSLPRDVAATVSDGCPLRVPGDAKADSGAVLEPSGNGDPSDLPGVLPSSEASRNAEPASAAAVQQAFVLGWHIAQLYNLPAGARADVVAGTLPGIDALNETARDRLQFAIVESGLAALCPQLCPPHEATVAVASAVAAVGAPRTDLSAKVCALHVDVLTALSAADFRLGKSYSLGRALAEIALLPATGADDAFRNSLDLVLGDSRVTQIVGWLSALKTLFPPHAAYAASRTLQMWQTDSRNCDVPDIADARRALTAQGQVWLSMLSGEKNPTDMLKEDDYVQAADALGRRFRILAGHFVKHYWWALLILAGVVAATITAVAVGAGLSGGAKLAADIAALAAALGITAKSATASISKVATHVEEPLWQSEVDESVAIAASRLPQSSAKTPPQRRDASAVGELRAYPPARRP